MLAVMGAVSLLVAIGCFAEGAGGAETPASSQSAVTGSPTAITVSSATFNGTVGVSAADTSWFFQYGPTTSYGADTPSIDIDSRAASVPVASHVGGLIADTVYHYRLVVRSVDGTTYGSDASFRTAAEQPTVVKANVAVVRDSSAIVDASIMPNGLATKAYVRFGTTAVLDLHSAVRSAGASDAPVELAIAISGLTPNTAYDFDVVATSAAGTSVSAEESFVTTGAPTVVSESAAALSTTSATLGGVINPDGHPTAWYIEYGTTTNYGSRTTVAHLGPSSRPIPVDRKVIDLTPNTTYQFRIVAQSAAGTVTASDINFNTLGPTLSASIGTVTVGRNATLSGTVPFGLANQTVAIYAQATNSPSFVEVASVLTGTGGNWGYFVSPRIDTSYKAVWDNEITSVIGISVRPSVRLRELAQATFFTRVVALTSFSHKLVRLERLENGTWRTIAFARLGRTSTAMFRPRRLVRGLSRLRVFFSEYQAGAGYLAGTSRVVRSFHG
jgi:hypothetical protein